MNAPDPPYTTRITLATLGGSFIKRISSGEGGGAAACSIMFSAFAITMGGIPSILFLFYKC